ncbi:hypothetical protein BDB00DRAFT_324972 [Zychaea mexicana]|uniref:uncharacterized protein n=1 Tax=Zychaea mexicana TaxID=64656 RepID=UPI0022FEADC7|nr:uncharacterized protein BDB00DRAFT_324972 [Zychaea mexicana]KAI9498888.1 hypothetical protein BDB00DRAFT_324972 [Zychaea mexicana]
MQLTSSIQEFQSMGEQAYCVLQAIQEQLEIVQQDFYAFRHRMHRLDLWMTANPDVVGAARLRLMLDHVHVSPGRYWLLYLIAVTVVAVAIVAFWEQL